MEPLRLELCIEAFITYIEPHIRKKSYSKPMLTNVLIKQNVKDTSSNEKQGVFTLLRLYHDALKEKGYPEDLRNEDTWEILQDSIEQSLRSYTRSKNAIKQMYEDLETFLYDEYDIELDLNIYGRIPETPFERQIEITKMLHHKELDAKIIADNLYISERAVTGYLKEMCSDNTDEGLIINGEKVQISFNKQSKKYTMSATMHPLILTMNLQQVIATLEGLYHVYVKEQEAYVYELALNIWNQLSEYGKDRIKKDISRLKLSADWYTHLEQGKPIKLYKPEWKFFLENMQGGRINWDYLIKSERTINTIYYEKDGVKTEFHNYKVLAFNEDKTKVFIKRIADMVQMELELNKVTNIIQ